MNERAADAGPRRPRRPLVLVLAASAFILVGAGGILKDVVPLVAGSEEARSGVLAEGLPMLALIWSIRALAVVGGVAVLRGHAWAHWLLAAWMILHVGISLQHSLAETAAHLAIFAVLSWALFRSPVSRKS